MRAGTRPEFEPASSGTPVAAVPGELGGSWAASQRMRPTAIPEDLRRFILTSVPSVPFVEALLLFRSMAGSVLAVNQVASRLYIGVTQAAGIVEELRAAGVIEADGSSGHRYAPAAGLAPMLDLLAAHYRGNLVEVSALIHSRTSRVAHQFADAFRLRKE